MLGVKPAEVGEASRKIERDAPAIAWSEDAGVLPQASSRRNRVVAFAMVDPDDGGPERNRDPLRLEMVVEDVDGDDFRLPLSELCCRSWAIRGTLPEGGPRRHHTSAKYENQTMNSHRTPPEQQQGCNRRAESPDPIS